MRALAGRGGSARRRAQGLHCGERKHVCRRPSDSLIGRNGAVKQAPKGKKAERQCVVVVSSRGGHLGGQSDQYYNLILQPMINTTTYSPPLFFLAFFCVQIQIQIAYRQMGQFAKVAGKAAANQARKRNGLDRKRRIRQHNSVGTAEKHFEYKRHRVAALSVRGCRDMYLCGSRATRWRRCPPALNRSVENSHGRRARWGRGRGRW